MAKPGLGAKHQRLRRSLPKPNGDLCPFHGMDPACPGPMRPGDDLDLDHVVPRILGGALGPVRWAHASCNRRDGARLGNLRRLIGLNGVTRSRRW